MLLFADTETTGLLGRPHIVQLAFIMTEDEGTVRASGNFIIRPEGYDIPEEVSAIHGITTDIAMRAGVPLPVAISAFNNCALNCRALVAHNINFDIRMIEYAYERGRWPSRIAALDRFCTMEATRNILKLPPTSEMTKVGVPGYKTPKLSESYEYAFGRPLENAHDALYDVNACKEIYFWFQGLQQERPRMILSQEISS